MRPTSWFEISLSTSWPKKSNLSRWSRLIRTKLVPLGTVRAPLDAYGSKKKLRKKESMCRFQFYFFFFSVTGFCFSNEGGFLLLFFKKHKMSFCSLTYKKKEFTELIELTSHWCIVSSRFKSRCHFIVPEWALSIFLGSCLFYSGKRSARIPFVHIGQMISVPLFLLRLLFQFVSCLLQTIRCIHHTTPLVGSLRSLL